MAMLLSLVHRDFARGVRVCAESPPPPPPPKQYNLVNICTKPWLNPTKRYTNKCL